MLCLRYVHAIGNRVSYRFVNSHRYGYRQPAIGRAQWFRPVVHQLHGCAGTLTFAPQNQGTTSASQNVNIFNSGSTAVSITGVQVTGSAAGDYAATNGCGSSVAANSHCTIGITFSPTATGTRTASLAISDSATGSPQTVSLTGTGQPGLQTLYISQTALTYAAQNLNTTSAPQLIQVVNNGAGTVAIGGVSIGGTNASDFLISTNNCTSALSAGTGCTIFVTFSPNAVGSRVASLQISDNATGSPQSVPLYGTGQTATQTIYLSSTVVQFAPQLIGVPSANPSNFYIQNRGNSNLSLNSFSITGTNASDYSITQNSCSTGVLAANAYCYIYIVFTPGGPGNRNALFQVADTAQGSPHTVMLTGVGQTSTSSFNLSANGLSFGQQNQYTTSAQQYFYIYNVGTLPFTINSLTLTGANAGDFSISLNECPLNPAQVAAAGSCYIYLQFTPTTTGQEYATLQIADSASGSPHVVQLSGIGVAQTQITSLQPNEISFGTVLLGSSSPVNSQYFYVYNKGTAPMTFTSFTVTGTNSGDFSIATNTCPGQPGNAGARRRVLLVHFVHSLRGGSTKRRHTGFRHGSG